MYLEELDNAKEVEKWIELFRKLIKKCPKNLWFFSGCSDGCVHIMCREKDGEYVYTKDGSVDSAYMIDEVCGPIWEGGDW